jgi:hypothetical protein
LTITETAARAAISGDSYVLTITYTDGSVKTSAGTVTVTGLTVTLKPSNSSGTLTITVSSGNMTGINGTIKFDDGSSAETITVSGLTKSPAVFLQDEMVYLSSGYPGYTNTPYSGSGTVKLEAGSGTGANTVITDIGGIAGGKLSFTFPAALDAKYLFTIADQLKNVSAENTADYTEKISGQTNTITVSPAGAKVATSGLRFIESGGNDNFYYRVSFGKTTAIENANSRTYADRQLLFIYSDRAATVKGAHSYTSERIYTLGSNTETHTYTRTWNITLQPGWNKVYSTYAGSWTWDSYGNDTSTNTQEYYTDRNKVDTSGWAWTIEPAFEELPYLLTNSDKTLVFNIMQRGDGITAHLPSDPNCDKWEHKSLAAFFKEGEWHNTDNSGEYIEFLAGGVLKFCWYNGEILTGRYAVDTAGKKIKFQWDD